MKFVSAWALAGSLLVLGMVAGCGGGDETPKNTKFSQQVDPKKNDKPKVNAMSSGEAPEKIPPLPGIQRKN